MARITLDLPADLDRRLTALGGEAGRSRAARAILAAAIHGERPLRPVANSLGGRSQVNIRLSREELLDVEQAAGLAGMTRPIWIASLIRRRLYHRPQFTRETALEIVAIHRELQHISARFSALAQASGTIEMMELEELRRWLGGQLAALRAAVEGDLDMWSTLP